MISPHALGAAVCLMAAGCQVSLEVGVRGGADGGPDSSLDAFDIAVTDASAPFDVNTGDGPVMNDGASSPPLCRIRAVMTGANHSCAWLADRTVACWGANDFGQASFGQLMPELLTPLAAPVTVGPVDELAVGADMTCVVRPQAPGSNQRPEIRCWGALPPVGAGARTVMMGEDISGRFEQAVSRLGIGPGICGVAAEPRVYCWGGPWTRSQWVGVGNAFWMAGTRVCIRDQLSRILCYDDMGGREEADLVSPLAIAAQPRGLLALEAGGVPVSHTFGVGRMVQRQLGTGFSEVFTSPSTGSFACFRRSGFLCFGANGRAQLGTGTAMPLSSPETVRAPALEGLRDLALGAAHGCGLSNDGSRVLCWGANDRGQAGSGTRADVWLPRAVTLPRAGCP